MPGARLIQADLTEDLPEELLGQRYHAILFTYSIHHLSPEEKLNLLSCLKTLLHDGGKIIIGDVMTKTREEMDEAMARDQNSWDMDESYIVVEKLQLKECGFHFEFYKKSYCSGVLVIW